MHCKFTLLFAAVLPLCFLLSCSAITTSQKAVVQEFATSAKSYSEAPKTLVIKYSECLYKSDQLEAATKHNLDGMISQLDLSSKNYLDRLSFTNDLNTTYQLISKYFQALVDFINVDTAKEFRTNVATLGTGIDSLISKSTNAKIKTIPLGFGTIAGTLAQYIGKARINKKQLSEFKGFIAKGDVLVEQASQVLNEVVLGGLITGELKIGQDKLKANYRLYLANLDSGDLKTGSFYKDLNPQYLDIRSCLGRSLLLVQKIADATTRFRAAHKEMVSLLASKSKKVSTKEIAIFIDTAAQIDDMIKQAKSAD